MALLLDLVRAALHIKEERALKAAKELEEEEKTGGYRLTKKQKDKIATMMFGKGGPGKSPKHMSLLKSTLELGFPQLGVYNHLIFIHTLFLLVYFICFMETDW